MQFLFKIQIYNKKNNTWRNMYHTAYQSSTNISSRAYGPRADIGFSGWYGDTDVAMYYSLCITYIPRKYVTLQYVKMNDIKRKVILFINFNFLL